MRRTVWIVVLGLLVAAVVAQSVALVDRQRFDEFSFDQVEPDGQVVHIRRLPWPSRFPNTAFSTKRPRRSTEDDKQVVWSKTVKGRGLVKDKEKDKAYDEALDEGRTLIAHDFNLSQPPSRDYVRNRIASDYKCDPGPTVEGVGETYVVKYELNMTREVLRELLGFERAKLAHDRMIGAFRLLLAASALLGCVAGYIRLDEYTKGYYTGRLRIAAVALGVLAAALIIFPD